MKKIIVSLLLVLLLVSCSSEKPTEVESPAEPTRLVVASDASLSQVDGKVYLNQGSQRSQIQLPALTLGQAETVRQPYFVLSNGNVYHDGNQLLAEIDGSQKLLINVADNLLIQDDRILVQEAGKLKVILKDGTVLTVTDMAPEDQLSSYWVPNQAKYVVKMKPDNSGFTVENLELAEESIEVTGQVVLNVPNEDSVIYRSPEQPNRLGKLNLATGDTTWLELGEGRDTILYGPIRLPNDTYLTVYNNQGQAEMVILDINQLLIQSTALGAAEDFKMIEQTADGYLIQTKNRVYQAQGDALDYFDFTADRLVKVPAGLLGINNNQVRVVKNDSFKDYQFPGQVHDAQLVQQTLVVIYTSPEGPVLSSQTIDF